MMHMKKIVLVLGAGASADLGYPLGSQLFDEVMADLNTDPYPGSKERPHYQSDGLNLLFKFHEATFNQPKADKPALIEEFEKIIVHILAGFRV